MQFIKTDMFD